MYSIFNLLSYFICGNIRANYNVFVLYFNRFAFPNRFAIFGEDFLVNLDILFNLALKFF